jgi:hypothetical protein
MWSANADTFFAGRIQCTWKTNGMLTDNSSQAALELHAIVLTREFCKDFASPPQIERHYYPVAWTASFLRMTSRRIIEATFSSRLKRLCLYCKLVMSLKEEYSIIGLSEQSTIVEVSSGSHGLEKGSRYRIRIHAIFLSTTFIRIPKIPTRFIKKMNSSAQYPP